MVKRSFLNCFELNKICIKKELSIFEPENLISYNKEADLEETLSWRDW